MTVYTAIIGPYDDVKEPAHKSMVEGWDCVLFTDQDLELKPDTVWRVVKVPVLNCGPSKTARRIKILFYEYIQDEFSLWIDGTFAINVNLNVWWTMFRYPFTAIRHPFDNCIYKDAASCIALKKDKHQTIKNQTDFYKKIGIKRNQGLISSGILMRQNTQEVRELCSDWWKQVEAFSTRDQIAFGYVEHKHPNVVQKINWNYTTQKEFVHIPHLNRKWRRPWNPSRPHGTN